MSKENKTMEITKTKAVFIAYTTDDKTEGRSRTYPWKVCEIEATAIRVGLKGFVQGSNCPVKENVAVFINNQWYAPCNIIPPNREDDKQEVIRAKKAALDNAQNAALSRAKELGLSDEDIAILSA